MKIYHCRRITYSYILARNITFIHLTGIVGGGYTIQYRDYCSDGIQKGGGDDVLNAQYLEGNYKV